MSDCYTGADLFVDALAEYGVKHVFGNPGTTELPVMKALGECGADTEYVLALHEDIAVGMASGYASTRRYHSHHNSEINPVGVANLHITPGLAHGIGNLYAAKWAGTPLVVTAGNHERDFRHEEPLLTGDLKRMVDQFCKYSDEVLSVDALPTMLRRAFRVALTPPTGPVFLGLPVDVMMDETSPEEIEPLGRIPNAGRGDPTQVERAADLLADAEEPLLVVGDHVARSGFEAVDAAVEFAEVCGARVHGEILACEVNFPTGHDQWISYLPPDEELASVLMDTDTIVFAGCSTNTTLMRHESSLVDEDTTCIYISNDTWQLGKNRPADVAIASDPELALSELTASLRDRLPDETRDQRVQAVEAMKESLEGTIRSMGEDETPEDNSYASKAELVDVMNSVAPDAYIVDESITAKYPLLTRREMQPEGMISNKGGGLGYGLPASAGAAIAESMRENPRDVIGYIGDGSYLYYPQTLYTAARENLDLTVVVPDNSNYRILKDNTISMFGGSDDDHEYIGMDIDPPVDLVKNAQSHGARAELVETPADIEPTLQKALDHNGPDVLDVLVHD
ncbi:thiamine pyrophosphate-binding protein [Natrinema sp. CGMCC1.2065]|uniref:thiamine pyrophosphate-binding protein n=1 Tax=Natrinema sp. CGMCC1.2065 TaxID=3445767 RepID=UPI003F4A2C35